MLRILLTVSTLVSGSSELPKYFNSSVTAYRSGHAILLHCVGEPPIVSWGRLVSRAPWPWTAVTYAHGVDCDAVAVGQR
jgi:hypothetical protein